MEVMLDTNEAESVKSNALVSIVDTERLKANQALADAVMFD